MANKLKIVEIIKRLGVPANISGYYYLRRAIEKMLEDNSYITAITKRLYPELAKEYNSLPLRIERGIRHAIEVGWIRGDVEFQHEIFGFSIDSEKGRLTNSEFIAAVADWYAITCAEGELPDNKPTKEFKANDIKCIDCEYLEFESPYAVCSKGYKGIVSPSDTCGKGKLRKGDNK